MTREFHVLAVNFVGEPLAFGASERRSRLRRRGSGERAGIMCVRVPLTLQGAVASAGAGMIEPC